MKKYFFFFLLFCIAAGNLQAQRYVDVASNTIDALPQTIIADSTAREQALPTKTIYRLERNGYYPMVTTINNNGFDLYIEAADGDGYRPMLQPSATEAGSYNTMFIIWSDLELKDITIENQQPTGGVNNRSLRLYNGSTIRLKNVEISHDRGGAVAIYSDSCSVIMEDCFFHSCGHPRSTGGNGRLIDVRASTMVDTLAIINTSFFNFSDRVIRNLGIEVNYLKVDHCTGLTMLGEYGGLQASKAKELVVTNNIFFNPIALGSRDSMLTEQNQPENDLMYAVTIDTVYDNSKIVVKNNNIWWAQDILDIWAEHSDHVKQPGTFTATILDCPNAEEAMSEELEFANPPDSIYDFVSAVLVNPNNTDLPENWFFGYQEDVDLSYGTTSISYTAADGGYPLGDLNWYPNLKEQWEAGQNTGVDDEMSVPNAFTLEQNYPNPFNPSTKISYTIPQSGVVTMEVFDVLGRKVADLVNEVQTAGQHFITFNGEQLSSGVYLYRLQASDLVMCKKMMLLK